MNNKIKVRRMSIMVPEPLFTTLKKVVIDYNCTMTKFVLRAVVEKLKREGEADGYSGDNRE